MSDKLESTIEQNYEILKESIDEICSYYVGNRENIEMMMAAIISKGHILLQDNPGIGKTFVSKLFKSVLGIGYRRIQFTPDLLPADITGTKVWRQSTSQFDLIKGPIFTNLLLADEINRAPPKTQAALLEAMEEKQVTIEGDTEKIEKPFIVFATQNPIEFEGTYPLPEAQLDRFMIQISFGYPEDDLEVVRRRRIWKTDDPSDNARKVMNAAKLIEIQEMTENIEVDEKIMKYISSFGTIRKDRRVLGGPSPRGIISLFRLSRGMALVRGRDYVIPDDVKDVAIQCLSHRIILKSEFVMEELKSSDVILDNMKKLEVPK
ncbi:AAA family ATPase [Caldiplasma sukawensis]